MEPADFQAKIGTYISSSLVMNVLNLADRTGLFKTMAHKGPMTVDEIAEQGKLQSRYVLEILSALVCAGIVEYDASASKFELPRAASVCLADESSPNFSLGWIELLPGVTKVLPELADAVKTGGGVPFASYGPEMSHGFERMSGPLFKAFLVSKWLTEAPGLVDKLKAGIQVADIGCGTGTSTYCMAEAFPKSKFVGVDLDKVSVERAKARMGDFNNLSNIEFRCQSAAELEPEKYDFILSYNMVHDTANPGELVKTIYKALHPDGIYIMSEPNCADSLEENKSNPVATIYYSISALHCMTVSLAQGGLGLGTCMGPKKAQELCHAAGFKHFQRLPIVSRLNLFFDIRKASPSA